MSSVLVMIIIPDKDYEPEVREKEQLSSRLHQSKKSVDPLKTISETEDADAKINSQRTMEKIVEDGLSYLGIVDATWQKSQNDLYHTIIFPVELGDSDVVIQYFKSLGIGLRLDTSIGIIPFSLFYYNEEMNNITENDIIVENEDKDVNKSIGNFKEKQNNFLKSVTARLTVAQVVNNVRTTSLLTFDFVCYGIFASWIAAMGLLENSVVSVVASMLVSPMMGPVMAFTFGTVIKDWKLIRMGARNVLMCFLITIGFGYLFGMIALNFTKHWGTETEWPTYMMRERGLLRVVWVGTLVAFPSGCAVAISLLSGNEASLVGVAISVSLLPPNVNGGLLWAYATILGLRSIGQEAVPYFSNFTNSTIMLKPAFIPDPNYSVVYDDNSGVECLILGAVSILLSFINITNIIIGAIILLKIKEIAPLATLSKANRRFFKEDIKIARQYNEKHRGSNLGEDVLKEWANIAGLDKNEFLKPESRAVQLHTLADIAKDVEADLVYRTVTRNMPITDNLARRLSYAVTGNPNFNRLDGVRCSRRSQIIPPSPSPKFVLNDFTENRSELRRPSNVSNNRRRISVVALNNFFDKDENGNGVELSPRSPTGIANSAFSFNESDIRIHDQQMAYERNRRNSSALLRRTLQNSEHSPYSLWPSTRGLANDNKFTVTPVSEDGKLTVPQI
ncbi:hypothetical protein RDWZM_001118 [Blomia tropicalis]|uniref:DUF389 domain-containing protein n=1 Tax=Blomia tropicalis TaxID=40697 RepID=A0A9Q0MA36_BLOTA|nr:hypothetical protein RDWZM_001118 [Blomia tropicalis]